ncbi:hypothetical protein [uncultured Rhodospira sp.]|uniref:hypothetical protein n=1 Tax=uncultured Rhodospira sp. TaxID=1936189 RepID=UPI0034596116
MRSESEHPFYFDHPLGHLPGLLLLDMALTAIERTVRPDGGALWCHRFDVAFRAMAAIRRSIEAEVSTDGPHGWHHCRLTQDGRLVAEAVGAMSDIGPLACPTNQSDPAPAFRPVAAARVRKARAENVFLGEPDPTQRWRIATAAEAARASLAPERDGVYRPTYLAECFLQLCRTAREVESAAEEGIPASREILVQLGGVLPRPLPARAELAVAFEARDIDLFFPRDGRALRRVSTVYIGKEDVGCLYCDAIQL